MARTSVKSPSISIAPCDVYENVGTVTLQGGTVESGEQALFGTQVSSGDGRVFAWTQGAVSMVVGKVYQSPAQDTANLQDLSVAAAAIGAESVTTTGATVTLGANVLAGGYMVVRTGTGAGNTYVISGNTAASAGNFTINLADPIRVALDTTSVVDCSYSPYYGVILAPATATGAPVGVAINPNPANSQGWIQIKGPAAVLAATNVTVGDEVVLSTGTAGAVVPASGTAGPVLGVALQTFSGGNYGLVNFNIN